MALLNANDAAAIRARFQQEMVDEVQIDFFTTSPTGLVVPGRECEYCATTQRLLEEVVALDSRLKLRVHGSVVNADGPHPGTIERIPAIIISRDDRSGMRFYGIPSGFEFGVLITDLIAVSRNESGLAAEIKAQLRTLDREMHLQVFVTPTCPHCPGASHLAHAMALESAHVRADVIESMEFPALADQYGVYGVPKVILNGTTSFEGGLPEPLFLQRVMAAAAHAVPASAGTRGGE